MIKKCKLVTKTYTTDSIGRKIATETLKEVFCDISSVSASEFSSAGQLGFKPEMRLKVWKSEYNDQDEVIVNGVHYTIYRQYIDRDGRVELYLQRRVGENE